MEVLTVLQSIIDLLATEKADIVITSISHFMLLIGLIYTVIHLVKQMFEKPIVEVEKLISQ